MNQSTLYRFFSDEDRPFCATCTKVNYLKTSSNTILLFHVKNSLIPLSFLFSVWERVLWNQCVYTCDSTRVSVDDQKRDIFLHLCEVKSKSGLFWNHTSSTLGHCSLVPSDDWLTTQWVDQEKNKHCPRPCHSVPVSADCLLTVHFMLRSDTLSQPLFGSVHLASSFLHVAMRTTMVAVVMVMCTMMAHADVKPQRDFNLQRVRETHNTFLWFIFDLLSRGGSALIICLLCVCVRVCVCVCSIVRVWEQSLSRWSKTNNDGFKSFLSTNCFD